jgi:hypothetical protein
MTQAARLPGQLCQSQMPQCAPLCIPNLEFGSISIYEDLGIIFLLLLAALTRLYKYNRVFLFAKSLPRPVEDNRAIGYSDQSLTPG